MELENPEPHSEGLDRLQFSPETRSPRGLPHLSHVCVHWGVMFQLAEEKEESPHPNPTLPD